MLLEASDRIGGRCVTDSAIFGVPFDLGAHWIHRPDGSLLTGSAQATALDIYSAPRGQAVRIGPRNARDSEMEAFVTSLVRARRAIVEAGRSRADGPAARILPAELGDWRPTIEFMLGPFACGKDLASVSAADLARVPERENDAFCRQGYGALIAKLAAGLPIRLSTPVTRIEWVRNGVDVVTAKGSVRARGAIVTVSTNVLTSGKIAFKPEIARRQLDAAAALSLGSYDHIALDIPRNPMNLQRDDLVFDKSSGRRTAALLANVSGTSLHLVEVAGEFGRELIDKRRSGNDRVCSRMDYIAVRLNRQKRDQAELRHPVERGSVRFGSDVSGCAGQRRRKKNFGGAICRSRLAGRGSSA